MTQQLSRRGVCLKGTLSRVTGLFIAADDLPVGVLDRRDVAVAVDAADEAQDERALADAACSEHDDTVVVALLGHAGLQLSRSSTDSLRPTTNQQKYIQSHTLLACMHECINRKSE